MLKKISKSASWEGIGTRGVFRSQSKNFIGDVLLGSNKPLGMIFENSINCLTKFPVNTGRKLNVHKTFRRRPGRPVPTGFVVIFKQNRTSVWKSFWNVVMFI